MDAEPYVLLIATGHSPQVVTETVWSLARQQHPPHHPTAVHVVTTATGAAYGRAQLQGQAAHDPQRGTPIEAVADRWTPFCNAVLDGPVPLHFHVPSPDGQPLTDIRTPADDTQFANCCYTLVARLTRPGATPLIGSIAGGRKTMSAHLMTAFCVYARAQDRLTHVLINPPAWEQDPDFFYPTAEATDVVRIDRVDVQFPRLRALLRDDLIAGLPPDRRDLQGILHALEPHLALAHTPTRIRLDLRSGEAHLRMAGPTGTLGVCRLSPAQAATLAVLAEALGTGEGRVSFDALYHAPNGAAHVHPSQHPVPEQRQTIVALCDRFPELTPWSSNVDVSKAVSRLNEALREVPIAAHYLAVESEVRREESAYHWTQPLPTAVSITARYVPGRWPFDHLPEPEPGASFSKQ